MRWNEKDKKKRTAWQKQPTRALLFFLKKKILLLAQIDLYIYIYIYTYTHTYSKFFNNSLRYQGSNQLSKLTAYLQARQRDSIVRMSQARLHQIHSEHKLKEHSNETDITLPYYISQKASNKYSQIKDGFENWP